MRTNFAKDFVLIREILEEGDFKKILFNLGAFEKFYLDLNRHIQKFIKSGINNLSIESSDLKELCDLAEPLVMNYQKKVNHNKIHKELWALDRIDDKHFNEWGKRITDMFNVIAKLRCFLSVISYAWCLLEAHEMQDEQNNDFTAVVVNAIQNHMRDYY